MTLLAAAEFAPPTLFDSGGGEPTLEDLISGAWEGLAAHSAVACPVCASTMDPEYGAHARPVGGRCRECSATLR